MIKVARGGNFKIDREVEDGIASQYGENYFPYDSDEGFEWVVYLGTPGEHPILASKYRDRFGGEEGYNNPNGWGVEHNVTENSLLGEYQGYYGTYRKFAGKLHGEITVPSNASLGLHTVLVNHNFVVNGQPYDYAYGFGFQEPFEVVCMTAQVKVTLGLSEPLGNGQYRHTYTATVTTEGGEGPFTYQWTVPGGATFGTGTSAVNFQVTNNEPIGFDNWGTASVTVTDSGGCTATDDETQAVGAEQSSGTGGTTGDTTNGTTGGTTNPPPDTTDPPQTTNTGTGTDTNPPTQTTDTTNSEPPPQTTAPATDTTTPPQTTTPPPQTTDTTGGTTTGGTTTGGTTTTTTTTPPPQTTDSTPPQTTTPGTATGTDTTAPPSDTTDPQTTGGTTEPPTVYYYCVEGPQGAEVQAYTVAQAVAFVAGDGQIYSGPHATENEADQVCTVHACPPGYVWDGTDCVPCFDAPLPQGAPVLVAKDCAGLIEIGGPVWVEDARHPIDFLELRREDQPGFVHRLNAQAETFVDDDVSTPAIYRYQVRAVNAVGASPWSPALIVSLVSPLVIEWKNPAANATLARKQTFVIKVTGAGLASLEVLYLEQPLQNVMQTYGQGVDAEYTVTLDTALIEWQGAFTLTAQATDINGCKTFQVRRTWNLNNSIETAIRWHDDDIYAPGNQQALNALVTGFVGGDDQPASSQSWFSLGAVSPLPNGFTPGAMLPAYYEDLAAREAQFLNFQPLKLGAEVGLKGTVTNGVLLPTGRSVLVRVRISPKEYLSKLAVDARGFASFRQLSEARVEVVTKDPCLIYWVDDAGLTLKADLRDYNAGAAVGACLVGDKIVAVMPDHVKVLDTTPGDASFRLPIENETLAPLRVEHSGSGSLVFYGDANNCAMYSLVGDQLRRVLTLPERCVLTAQRGGVVALVGRTPQGVFTLRELHDGALNPEALVLQHQTRIKSVLLTGEISSYAFQFGDLLGRVFEPQTIGEGDVRQVANFDFAPLALGQFKGAAKVLRRAAGGADRHLWLEVEEADEDPLTGRYRPRVTLEEGARITALDRINVVVVPAQGDPLKGGKPAVQGDALLAGVELPQGNAYILRLQEAAYDQAYSYGGTDLIHYAAKVTNSQ